MNAERIALALPIVLILAGCGGSLPSAATPSVAAETSAAPPSANVAAEAQPSVASVESMSTTTPPSNVMAKTVASQPQPQAKTDGGAKPDPKKDAAQSADFLVMYVGDVTMSVDDAKVTTTLDRIIDVSETVGGHLAVRRDQSVQIRVPSPRFRETLAKIAELGQVTHQSVSAEDVSEEFHDEEVRLANMKATQKRLQDFLAKSANLSDMLTLEHELERVSMDIDRIEGRMRYLREHVAFSTLTVALVARPKTSLIASANGTVATSAPKRIMPLDAPWLDDMGVQKLEN